MAGKRTVENIPDTFRTVKQEIEHKFLVRFWLSKEKNLEGYALLKIILDSLLKFVEGQLLLVEQKLLDLMTEEKVTTVTLGKYGKKVFYDEDAEWLYVDDFSDEDWREFDKKCNQAYTEDLIKKGLA